VELRNVNWSRPSADDQRMHAILHAIKAAGRLAAILESEGHGGVPGEPTYVDQPKFAADLVISAVRLADVCGFDLEDAVINRQKAKNSCPP
jgi:hypothetical protein